jgi:alpha-amylase
MEHIQGSQWWTRYQPVSYNLTSRSGNYEEFVDMTQRCKAVGVEVIADAVINHMAASPSGTAYGIAGTSYYGRSFEPYGYNSGLMHHLSGNNASNCAVTDYTDATNVQQCDLVGCV